MGDLITKEHNSLLVELTVPLKITYRKLIIVKVRNIETLFLIFWIMDSIHLWSDLFWNWIMWTHCPIKHQEHWKNPIFVNIKPLKPFIKELNKVALLVSYTIRKNTRQEPARGFTILALPFILLCSFLNFFIFKRDYTLLLSNFVLDVTF